MDNEATRPALSAAALYILQDIFRAYRGEYALNLASSTMDAELGELFEAGFLVARPLASAPYHFEPSELAMDTFVVVDSATGSTDCLEPRNADRFVIRYASQLPLGI